MESLFLTWTVDRVASQQCRLHSGAISLLLWCVGRVSSGILFYRPAMYYAPVIIVIIAIITITIITVAGHYRGSHSAGGRDN